MDNKILSAALVGAGIGAAAAAIIMKKRSIYKPPKVWANTSSGGAFAHINKPTAGPQKELALPKGSRPLQLYSLATPNGVKVTALLEELVDAYPDFEYDAWFTMIMGSQFGSGFVGANPNSKIPCMLHYAEGEKEPVRIFESASILMYLCDNFDPECRFRPAPGTRKYTECMNWVFWQMGSAPFLGGGFGHFYHYAPLKIEYAINRYAMEAKRQLDVLERHLGNKDPSTGNGCAGGPWILGDTYSIADMAIWPWYGALVLGKLYGDAATFLQVDQYTHVLAWAKRCVERPGSVRGRMVNRSWDSDAEQLLDRHSRADFETATTAARKAAIAKLGGTLAALAAAGPVLTAAAPGAWAGKEAKHVPDLSFDAEKKRASVRVAHGSDADHFIQYIWVVDQAGAVVAAVELAPGDAPALDFMVPKEATSLAAFEACNLHGVWTSGPMAV